MVTLQIMPHTEISSLSSIGKIRKLLNVAKQNKIVLLQGRLTKEEEAELIKATMEEINKEFKGIELAVINPTQEITGLKKIKYNIAKWIFGNQDGLTVIGPANIIKKIKKDPNKIELLTKEKRKRK
ncbi:hypothetical protein B6U93_00695 [Candidatus Woesearchaeota archaeon ex4484_78]|nr:MAG: hypothetical protein B6U93_00695 [Candidatus Woesearchaeota archaeon ex4484_78]